MPTVFLPLPRPLRFLLLSKLTLAEHRFAAPTVYAGYPTWNLAGLVAHPNGAVVPAESPEVARARAEHLAAHAAA